MGPPTDPGPRAVPELTNGQSAPVLDHTAVQYNRTSFTAVQGISKYSTYPTSMCFSILCYHKKNKFDMKVHMFT
ncbi:unnamed protein product [Staurois parvus]|uniref:Uncharacterized protein n=1 Tax=Staurois parvus TaxID=386267 RepID=A0ABN9DUD9_9NEOB|nr:unnamed protein product [Staurois parvus]